VICTLALDCYEAELRAGTIVTTEPGRVRTRIDRLLVSDDDPRSQSHGRKKIKKIKIWADAEESYFGVEFMRVGLCDRVAHDAVMECVHVLGLRVLGLSSLRMERRRSGYAHHKRSTTQVTAFVT
jgi:hypothetical protein